MHELNNTDKHRYPLISVSAAHQARFGFSGPGVGVPEPRFAPDSLDFVEDDRVATFRFAEPHPEIDLNAEFELGVFFDEIAPPDDPATMRLIWIAHYVRTRVIEPLADFL